MALTEDYIQSMIGIQTRLYAFLLTLLADAQAADDVLQETNVVLCRRASEFEEGSNFAAWAFKTARLQCMAYWKVKRRDRLIFSEDAYAQFAKQTELLLEDIDDRIQLLRNCLSTLPDKHQAMLQMRYSGEKNSVKSLAKNLGRSESSVSLTLHRLRSKLLKCVQIGLAARQS